VLGLGLGLVSGSSLVGVCRRLAAVMWSTYTTVVSVVCSCRHNGRVRNINLILDQQLSMVIMCTHCSLHFVIKYVISCDISSS